MGAPGAGHRRAKRVLDVVDMTGTVVKSFAGFELGLRRRPSS
jgi:hypothetical protein